MARILAQSFGERYRCRQTALPHGRLGKALWARRVPRGAVVFFTKWAALRAGQGLLDALRARGALTCLDYVDADHRRCLDIRPDVHVAMSFAGADTIRGLLATASRPDHVALIHPAIDDRLLDVRPAPDRPFSAAYFGLLDNMFRTEEIGRHVAAFGIANVAEMGAHLPEFARHSFHYCVRNRDMATDAVIAKPFTKGFVAAYCGSPVLFDAGETDALKILGADYPFIVRERSEAAVLQTLGAARAAYAGPVWTDALERMKGITALCAHEAIAHQFHAMVSDG